MADLTTAQLIELGKKTLARQEKEAKRAEAYNTAVKKLKASHEPEFEKYLKEEKAKLGL